MTNDDQGQKRGSFWRSRSPTFREWCAFLAVDVLSLVITIGVHYVLWPFESVWLAPIFFGVKGCVAAIIMMSTVIHAVFGHRRQQHSARP